jgi:dienelactone hydrolase
MQRITILVLLLSLLQLNLAQQDCTLIENPVFTSEYTPKGNVVISADMDTYETGDPALTTMLIGVYDIYGFNPNTNIWQICDTLAAQGYRVALPDFFHGEPWKREHYPYPTDEEFYEFVRATSWEESVRADLRLVLDAYKAQGITKFGIFGFCFGGRISAMATNEYYEEIQIAGHFHPASVNIIEAVGIKSPTILLPGANDPDMTDYCQLINDNLGDGSCLYHHFLDVNHGYAGGRADWLNSTVVGRAQDAVRMFQQFLCNKQF